MLFVPATARADFPSFKIADGTVRIYSSPWNRPAVHGDVVVWNDCREAGWYVYGKDLSTDEEFPISTVGANYQVAIDGGTVVFSSSRDGSYNIYGFDLPSRSEFDICTAPEGQVKPDISGQVVVWQDGRHIADPRRSDIFMRDLATGTETAVTWDVGYEYEPTVDGTKVVWVGNGIVYVEDLTTGQRKQIWRGTHPRIDGNIVVWDDMGGTGVYGFDIAREQPLQTPTGFYKGLPDVSADIVVWSEDRNGPGGTGKDIYGLRLATGEEFPICTAPGRQDAAAIHGQLVVWYAEEGGTYSLYGAYIPEPSVPVLLAAAGLGLLRRRGRRP